jgi:hypothetical protein
MALSAPQSASRSVQNVRGARASGNPCGVWKSARANKPTAEITTAVVIIIAADSPSARSAMPSGGAQPPTT